MTKFRIFGFLLGIAAVAWFGYALFKGEIGIAQSQLQSDVKTLSREENPMGFYLAMGGAGVLILLYWVVLFWFLRNVLPRMAGSTTDS